ncbi:PREDICTED: titin homolog isoform X2 [Nelumbo nucifera]|uniref:Titin homolog isoform X2 n=1 Tax=Nelumbo nucifera TaxID=4432 RepID=A0A1U8Q0R6_NELNU|nr:PREDICTED: titin homolog isoform X2 [Nelumbo nucifera]
MERLDGLDFDSVKGARKPRTFVSRKPRTASSQMFLNDCGHDPLLSPLSSSPFDNGPATHNGSSSENLSLFASDDNGCDQGAVKQKNRKEEGSLSNNFHHERSGNLGNIKHGKCWGDNSVLDLDNTRNVDDADVAGEYDRTKLGRNHNRDGKGLGDLKARKENVIVEDKKSGRFSASSKGDPEMNVLENPRVRVSKGLYVKDQVKPGSNARCSEGVLAPARKSASDWGNQSDSHSFKGSLDKPGKRAKRSSGEYDLSEGDSKLVDRAGDPSSQENRPTKVKLKVGGVTHTLHANHNGNSDTRKLHVTLKSSDIRQLEKVTSKENSDDCLQRMEKYVSIVSNSRMDGSHTSEGSRRSSEETAFTKKTDNDIANSSASQAVRKSSRVRKRRVLDGEHSDDGNEDKALYQSSKASKGKVSDGPYGEDFEEEAPKRRSSRVPKRKVAEPEYHDEDENYYTNRFSKNSKKKRVVGRVLHDSEESAASSSEDISDSDLESDVKKKKSIKRELVGSFVDEKKETSLTARQRALQSVKEAEPKASSKFIDFPDGLLEAGQRKQKEKISDLDQQLKKAEAAQRRRMQVEKAAKEIQAEAIRKILGHNSNRESRRDKLRQKQTEIAKEKSSSVGLGSNTIRWVIGPTGTTVSFSEDAGLPSIFSSTISS